MSSTETLNFGPEWLRALSTGTSSVTSPPPSPAVPTTAKFKLAEFRYGREEMLALFVANSEVPSDLLQAPHLISEDTLQPLALIPLTEDDQRAFSGGVNSETHFRPRGALSTRGRSAPPRGRGRGRGEGFSRSISQNEEGAGPPYSQRGREFNRRESWEERGFGRNGRGSSEDGPIHRKPLRRSDVSDDWRSDIIRGSGDGADAETSEPASDWRPPAPSRRDWRGRSNSNWRDTGRDWSNDSSYHPRERRVMNRTRSLGGSKYDQGDSGLMPEWAEDGEEGEVGVFDASGAFQTNSKTSTDGRENGKASGPRKATIGRPGLRKIEERDKLSASEKEDDEKQDENTVNDGNKEPEQSLLEEKEKETPPKESPPKVEKSKTSEPPVETAAKTVEKPAWNALPKSEDAAQNNIEKLLGNVDTTTISAPKPISAIKTEVKTSEQEEVDNMHHLEQAALKLVDSLSEESEKSDWPTTASASKPPALTSEALVNQAIANVNATDLATKWFYKDPQGETQGPFTSQEMREWFLAGYFTLNLLVKRAFDPVYAPLGELMTRWGGIPFSASAPTQPTTSDPQTEALQQQLLVQKQLQALQQQQQQQQQQAQKQQQQQQQIQQQLQQEQAIRSYQLQNALYNAVIAQLSKSEQFLSLPSPQQQAMVAHYMSALQQQQQHSAQQPVSSASASSAADTAASQLNLWDIDPAIVRRPSPVHMATQQQSSQQPPQHQQFLEMLKQKSLEKEQVDAKKKQELKEMEEKKRKEDDLKRLQQLQVKQQEAMMRQAEEIRKQKELEDAKRKQEEMERKRRQEEIRLREEKRQQEEETKLKHEEEVRKQMEEEERKRRESLRRLAKQQEEERRQAQEEEVRRKREEEQREKKRKQQEEQEMKRQAQLRQAQEEEMRRRAMEEKQMQEEALQKQKEQELQRQKEEAARKRQQEQLKNMKLPSTANWAQQQQQQQPQAQNNMSSVLEIQKLQEEKERERKKLEQEHMRVIQQQQQQQQRPVWGSAPANQGLPAASNPGRPLSLMEIQMEEARKQRIAQMQQQNQVQQKPDLSIQAAAAWGGRQTTGSSVWGQQSFQQQQQQQQQQSFWEQQQAQSNQARKQQQQQQQQAAARQQTKQSRGKSRGGSGGGNAEDNSVMALFQQQQQQQSTQDPFVAWCDAQIKQMPAASNLDVPTFVAFLRDVESPYDVKDYVTSYLGETKDARDFAEAFLQQRSAMKKQQQQQQQAQKQQAQKKQQQNPPTSQSVHSVVPGWNQTAPTPPGSVGLDDEGEFVTGSTKRGKRKQKKLQRVDPSILGFSVNAASNRVNMGEIETPNDG